MLRLPQDLELTRFATQSLSIDQIEILTMAVFYASFRRVEGQYYPIRVCVASPESRQEGLLALLADPNPASVDTLARLSSGASHSEAWLAACPTALGLRIWGILRKQGSTRFCFTVRSLSPGEIEISSPSAGSIKFKRGQRAALAQSVFASRGPVMEALLDRVRQWSTKNTLGFEYLEVIRSIVAALARSGHGGTLLCLPRGVATLDDTLDAKHGRVQQCCPLMEVVRAASQGRDELNNTAVVRMMCKIVEVDLSPGDLPPLPDGASLEHVYASQKYWSLHQEVKDLSSSVGSLGGMDGALVLTDDLRLLSFGTFINAGTATLEVRKAEGVSGTLLGEASPLSGGTRHASAAQYCQRREGAIAFVVSQDGDASCFLTRRGELIQWVPLDLESINATPFDAV